MSHNPQNILRDLTRNPLHVGLVVACCVLSVAIIVVLVARESNRPAAKQKIHPLDKPPAKVAAVEPEGYWDFEVDHVSDLPGEVATLAERSLIADWGRFTTEKKLQISLYLAATLHPNDSPYAHRLRIVYYAVNLNELVKDDTLHRFTLVQACVAKDAAFADYLASQAEAPK